MHQYKIEIYRYTEDGAVGALVATKYADNPEQARLICQDYENLYQTRVVVDEDGTETEVRTGNKMYKVCLYILCYKLCQDRAAFFAQFQA